MFDRKCKDCIVLKRIKNAFVREELKNSELIIQNGKTYDDAIIINEQGKEILEFINNKRTVEEIINLMIQKISRGRKGRGRERCVFFYMREKGEKLLK